MSRVEMTFQRETFFSLVDEIGLFSGSKTVETLGHYVTLIRLKTGTAKQVIRQKAVNIAFDPAIAAFR